MQPTEKQIEEMQLSRLTDDALAICLLLEQAQTDTLADEHTANGRLFKDTQFANPITLSAYMKQTVSTVSKTRSEEDIDRLCGEVSFARLLLALDELSYEDALYLRQRLHHGFRGMGSCKRVVKMLDEVDDRLAELGLD